jgi:hypothetical protein
MFFIWGSSLNPSHPSVVWIFINVKFWTLTAQNDGRRRIPTELQIFVLTQTFQAVHTGSLTLTSIQ